MSTSKFSKPTTSLFKIIAPLFIFLTIQFAPITNADTTISPSNPLLPKFEYNEQTGGTKKIDLVRALPQGTWQQALASIITTILNTAGALTLLSLTVGGIIMITSRGNQEATEKGKKILFYSIAGLAIIATSYAIVLGISQLQFFTTGTSGSTTTTSTSPSTSTSTPNPSSTGGIDTSPNPTTPNQPK